MRVIIFGMHQAVYVANAYVTALVAIDPLTNAINCAGQVENINRDIENRNSLTLLVHEISLFVATKMTWIRFRRIELPDRLTI
ncbi:MAG: hypothetical protein ACR2O4_02465 [Hyphomicrobiaceae bacterium]